MLTTIDFETAYRKGFRQTARLLASRGLAPDRAEEISQAAWAKGWERREQLRNPSAVSSWVNTIALNLWREQLTRRPVQQELQPFQEPHEKPSALNARLDVSKLHRHSDAEDFRLLWWQAVMGFTSKEVAAMTGSTAVAVRVRTMRFKQTVRQGTSKTIRPRRREASDQQARTGCAVC